MIASQRADSPSARPFRIGDHRAKKIKRAGFCARVVERLENQGAKPGRRPEPEQSGDHGAVAVSPKSCPLDTKRVEEPQRLFRCTLVKVHRKRSDLRGAAITRAIRYQNVAPGAERGDLPAEVVDFVTPAAVQEDERRPAAGLPIIDARRAYNFDESRVQLLAS